MISLVFTRNQDLSEIMVDGSDLRPYAGEIFAYMRVKSASGSLLDTVDQIITPLGPEFPWLTEEETEDTASEYTLTEVGADRDHSLFNEHPTADIVELVITDFAQPRPGSTTFSGSGVSAETLAEELRKRDLQDGYLAVSYTHLTLPTKA